LHSLVLAVVVPAVAFAIPARVPVRGTGTQPEGRDAGHGWLSRRDSTIGGLSPQSGAGEPKARKREEAAFRLGTENEPCAERRWKLPLTFDRSGPIFLSNV